MKTIAPQKIQEVTNRLVKEFHPQKIILFGSYAWGTPTNDSDLDLMVVIQDSNERPAARARRAYHCLRGINVPKDILVRTDKELNRFKHVKASLECKVIKDGKVLYGQN